MPSKMLSQTIVEHINIPPVNPSDIEIDTDSSDDDSDENMYKLVHEVPDDRIRFVIGSNGDSIKAIQEKSSTDINKIKWKEDKKQCIGFLIVGPKYCVVKAKTLIDDIVNQRKRKICRYYLDGHCNSGSKCNFLHQKDVLTKRPNTGNF